MIGMTSASPRICLMQILGRKIKWSEWRQNGNSWFLCAHSCALFIFSCVFFPSCFVRVCQLALNFCNHSRSRPKTLSVTKQFSTHLNMHNCLLQHCNGQFKHVKNVLLICTNKSRLAHKCSKLRLTNIHLYKLICTCKKNIWRITLINVCFANGVSQFHLFTNKRKQPVINNSHTWL